MSEGGTSRTVDSEGGDVRPPSSNQPASRKLRIKIIPPKRDGTWRIGASESEVGSPSNHSTSMKRARPSPQPGPGPGPGPRTLFYNKPGPPPPRRKLNLTFDGLVRKANFDALVGAALSSFNETSQAKGDPLYEVVEFGGFILSPALYTYHFNFIGRPKDGSDAEKKLFFGEVRCGSGLVCSCCCILGPPDTVTGLCGCHVYCANHPNHVQHPPQGGFISIMFCPCVGYCYCPRTSRKSTTILWSTCKW